jgi:hypothetical protein
MADRQYCASASVTAALPTGYDDTLDATAITNIIKQSSEECDGALPDYWPFPDHDSTPATPRIVTAACLRYSWAECLHRLGMYDGFDDLRPPHELRREADEILAPYARGVSTATVIISKRIPPETIENEVIDWEPDGTALESNEHVFAQTNCEVIPETVEIAGYKYGIDYRVDYKTKYNRWILTKLNDDITEGEGEDTVTYQISYLRQRHDVPLMGPKSIKIRMA